MANSFFFAHTPFFKAYPQLCISSERDKGEAVAFLGGEVRTGAAKGAAVVARTEMNLMAASGVEGAGICEVVRPPEQPRMRRYLLMEALALKHTPSYALVLLALAA